MVLGTIDVSPTVSFKRQPKNIKCACSTVPIKYKKSKISAVRWFPEGCGPHRRIVADSLNGVVQEGVPFLVYDSEPEEVSVTTSMEHMEVSMPKALDTEGLFSLSNRLKYESIELSKKVVVDILPGVYPPDRRISATGSFPEGCGAKATEVCNKIAWRAIPSEDNGREHQISSVKGMSFGKTSKTNAHKNKAILWIMPRVYPPPRKIWAHRWFPKGCGRESLQSRKEVAKQAIASAPNGSISQCGNMNQLQEEVPPKFALPVHRVIVLGLMAVKLALYATAFSRYAPLKVEPLKSDSLISAAVKFALLKFSFTCTAFLRSAEPNWAADPIPNSPRVSASYLFRSARAEMLELHATTAAANAVETKVLQLPGFAVLEQSRINPSLSELI